MLKLALPSEKKNKGGILGGAEYIGASALAGVGGVFEGTADLVLGTMAALGGDRLYAKNLFSNNVVGNWHKNVADGYNPDKALRFVGDVTSGLGQSATMLIPVAGVPLFFAGAIGGGIGSAVEKTGELGAKEYLYGTTTGVVEGLLERYVGSAGQALGKVTKGAAGNIMTKLSSNIAKKWAASAVWKGVAKDMMSNAAGEFVEEALSEAIDPVLQRGFGIDEDASTTMKEILYAGLVGFGSGLLMGGATVSINTGVAYKVGTRTVANGNVDTVVADAHRVLDALKIDNKTKDIAPYITGLKSSLESYERTANKGSSAAMIYLGEVQGYMSAVESSRAVLTEAVRMANVSESAADSYAKYMSYADKVGDVSKNYTAEDWYNDKNKIRTRYAAYKWAGAFLGDTVEMAESLAFDEAIRADREGRAVGTPTVQDITEASFTGESGTYNVSLGEGQTSQAGDYIRVMKLGEDSYSIAQGNSSENVRGYRALTREQAKAEFERIKGAVATERGKVAQNQNLEAVARAAQEEADRLRAPGSFATKSQQRTADKAAATAAQALAEGRQEIDGTYANIPTGEMSENPYTAAQMNAARKAVENFDMLSADQKGRILRWMQSVEGKGINADVVSGVANIIRLRPDLQVMLGETKQGVAGFHEKAVAGRNLIVLSDGKDINLLRETIAHELGHEIEGTEGYEDIKKAALKATKEEDIEAWRELYKEYDDVDAEVAAKALGRRLATPRFIERYANKSTIRRIIDGAKAMLETLRADKAGRLEIDETEKLIRMMDRAIVNANVHVSGKDAGKKQHAMQSKKDPTKLDPRTVTKGDVLEMLKNAEDGVYNENTYIPVRISTPAIVIQRAKEKLNKTIPNYPLIMSAGKAINAMEREGYGDDGLPNRLAPEEIVNIIEAMSNPLYIVYQKGTQEHPEPRYVEVVKFDLKNSRKAFAVLELTGDYKNAIHINGYESGQYNIFVTVFPPKDYKLKELLTNKNNVVIYDKKKDYSQVTSGNTVPSVLNDQSFFTNSISQTDEKSTPSAKKSHNLTEEAADQAARDAAEVEKSADQREKDLRKREKKAAKAERDAEIKRIETRARDYNAYYYKYEDIEALIDTINKEANLGFDDVSDAAFEAYSSLNAFRADVTTAEYRKSFLDTTTETLIEAADAQAGRELRLSDIERRRKVYKLLNEAYEKLAKVTPKQKTEGRRARAESEARFEHKTAELHMLMTQVEVRRFREKTTGVLSGTQWKALISALKGIRTRSAKIKTAGTETDMVFDIQPAGAYNFIKEFAAFIKANAESLYDFASSPTPAHAQAYDAALAAGDNQLYQKISINTARKVLEFANSNGEFDDAAIEATVAAVKTVLAIDRWSDMYIRNGKAVDVEPLAFDTLKGLKTSFDGIGGKFAQTAFGKALKYGFYNVISPEAVVHRVEGVFGTKYLSESIHSIQRASLDAQYDQMKFMTPLVEYIQKHKKTDKQWWKDWQDQELSFTRTVTYGKKSETVTVKVTKGEAAAIYLTSLRYHALPAMALGRVTIANNDGKGGSEFNIRRMNFESLTADIEHQMESMDDAGIESLMNGLIVQLKKDVNDLYAQFTDADKKFISEIEKWYQTTSKNVKKETDTLIYGSTNVYDGYYYPIQREGNEFAYDFIGMPIRSADDISVYGYAFNKNTVRYANAQLNINDALITLDRHSRQLAMYKNLTIPLQNLRLLYNYTLKPGEGAERGIVTGDIDTVRKYITTYVWPSQGGRGGFDQWIGDFSNAVQKRNIGSKTEFDMVLDKIQSGYVVAALGLNPSSIAKQWSTIMQMVEEVPPSIWMKAYDKAENKDMMLKYSRYASVRKNNSEIYFAQGVSAKVNDFMSNTLKGLEAGDYLVNLRMWNMAQYYVAEKSNHPVGSEENMRAAGKVLDEWILRFQDTSDASTKSALQRHPQKLAQAVTMFTSAPMKKFSSFYTHLTDAVEANRLIKSNTLSEKDLKKAKKVFEDSKKKLGKSVEGIMAAAAFETAITLMWAALRGKDDDDEEKKRSLVAKIALETSANVVGIVPVAGQIAESLLSGYDMDNLYESILNDGISTVRTTYQLSTKALVGEKVESEAVMRNARSWTYLMSQVVGVPVRNLNNVFQAGLTVISPIVPQAKYRYEAIFYEPTYAADMSKALKSGNTRLAQTIYSMAQKDVKTGGAAADAVVSEMVRLYGMEYNVLPRSAPTTYEDEEGNTVKMKAKQARQFSEIYGAADSVAALVVTSPVYVALPDELKAKALRVSYEIYHSRAKSEVLGSDLSVVAALSYLDGYLDVATLVTESAYLYGIKSTADAKRSELVRQYVSGYSSEAQAILLYAAGYRSDAIKETLASLVASLDEDVQQRVKNVLDF